MVVRSRLTTAPRNGEGKYRARVAKHTGERARRRPASSALVARQARREGDALLELLALENLRALPAGKRACRVELSSRSRTVPPLNTLGSRETTCTSARVRVSLRGRAVRRAATSRRRRTSCGAAYKRTHVSIMSSPSFATSTSLAPGWHASRTALTTTAQREAREASPAPRRARQRRRQGPQQLQGAPRRGQARTQGDAGENSSHRVALSARTVANLGGHLVLGDDIALHAKHRCRRTSAARGGALQQGRWGGQQRTSDRSNSGASLSLSLIVPCRQESCRACEPRRRLPWPGLSCAA